MPPAASPLSALRPALPHPCPASESASPFALQLWAAPCPCPPQALVQASCLFLQGLPGGHRHPPSAPAPASPSRPSSPGAQESMTLYGSQAVPKGPCLPREPNWGVGVTLCKTSGCRRQRAYVLPSGFLLELLQLSADKGGEEIQQKAGSTHPCAYARALRQPGGRCRGQGAGDEISLQAGTGAQTQTNSPSGE